MSVQINNEIILNNNDDHVTLNDEACIGYETDGHLRGLICIEDIHEDYEMFQYLPIGEVLFCTDIEFSFIFIDYFEFFSGMICSIPFLLVTTFIYLYLPELRKTLHTKCFVAYVTTLTVFYIFLAGLQLNSGETLLPALCYIIAFVIYGTHMSLFLWVAVISFEIWWTFG